jgi:hypothetical protein
MGILDRIKREKRMGRFEERHYLDDEDKIKINEAVKKVYHNILNGYMTRPEGKEYLLKYVTSIVQKKYPGIDLEKTGLANKINRYASMKIRKLDEPLKHEGYKGGEVEKTLQLGRAKRLGKLGGIKEELKREVKKRRIEDPEQARSFLKAFARSNGMRVVYPEYGFRDLVDEVIDEAYDEKGLKKGRLAEGRKVLPMEKKFWEERPQKPQSFEKVPKTEYYPEGAARPFFATEKIAKKVKEDLEKIWEDTIG